MSVAFGFWRSKSPIVLFAVTLPMDQLGMTVSIPTKRFKIAENYLQLLTVCEQAG